MRNRKAIAFCSVLLVLNLALIWGNSALPGDESGALSSGLLALILQYLPFLSFIGETLLRKAAHFTEFMCLGLLLTWLHALLGTHGRGRAARVGLCGLLTACVDETIQIFSVGRASSLLDVWIDFAGVVTGFAIVSLGYRLSANDRL